MRSQMPEEQKELLEEIEPLLESEDESGLRALLCDRRSSDIAEVVELVDNDRRRLIFDVLETPIAAEVLEKVNEAESKLAAGRPTKPAKPAKPAESGVIKPGRWIDLLPLADPAKDAVKGKWTRQADALAILSPTAAGCIAVPIAPQGSYELQVKFVRTSGDDLIAVFLPVGAARVTLVMSHGHGRRSGLTRINGKGVEDNQTAATPGTLVNGREYAVHVTVLPKGDQARIAVRLDGKPYINWRGPQSALSVHSDWDLREPGCLGLGAWQAPVVFRSVRLKMLSGQARPLRPAEE